MVIAGFAAYCSAASARARFVTRRARCSWFTRPDRSAAAALERERADLVVLFRGVIGAWQRLFLLGDVRPRLGRLGSVLEVRRPVREVELARLLRAAHARVDV